VSNLNVVCIHIICFISPCNSNVRQAMQQEYKSDEAEYEIVDKSSDLKMDKNPVYSVEEETSINNQYVNVPNRRAKVKQ